MYLGIDQQKGLLYEGSDGPVLPAVPTPSVTQAKLIEAQPDWDNHARRHGAKPVLMGFPRGHF
ncbi:hypothetical protein SAMN05444680_103474 [Variovorax sp. YR216]|nr:hypothetical protein SAMN05444680_103474 [Variovorax sp. YR216]